MKRSDLFDQRIKSTVPQQKVRESSKAGKFTGSIKEFKIILILCTISKTIHVILICISSEEC